jgi:nitrate/nitrite transporter NarK
VRTRDEEGELGRPPAWRWAVLGLASVLFVCSQFYRVANAVVAPQLQQDLGLSSEALGGLSAAFFYAFAVAQVPLALLLDRVGARWSMAVLSLVGAVGAVVFASAGGLASATAGRILLGVGMAGNLMGTMKLVAEWFSPREFATLTGLVAALGTAGNILATTPLALLVAAVGWRRSFVLVAVLTALLAVVFWAVVRDRAEVAGERGPEVTSIAAMARTLLGSRDYWLISVGAFCRYGTFVAIQGLWVGPYLMEVAGLSPVASANLILLLNLAVVLGSPFGGWLSDRVFSSRKRLALMGLAGTGLAELALALSGPRPPVGWLVVVLVFLGVTTAFGQVVYAHVKELMPLRMSGMAMTGVNFFTMFGAATFLHAMGWVLDRASGGGPRGLEGYRAAFLAAAVSMAVAFALYLTTREARSSRTEPSPASDPDPAPGRAP